MGERKGVDEEMSGKPVETTKLTDENKKALQAIMGNMTRVKLDQEAIKDDIKAVADKLGWKPGKVAKVIRIIMAEQEKGGIIMAETEVLELAEQALTLE